MSGVHTRETRAIQRRLEALEIEHLRQLVAQQARRIARLHRCNRLLHERVDYWRRESYDESRRADLFHDLTLQMQDSLKDQKTGLTLDGRLILVPDAAGAPQ